MARLSTLTQPSGSRLALLTVVLVLTVWRQQAQAVTQKYNVTKATAAKNLTLLHLPQTEVCYGPGVCSPANQSVPANTLWYWCGFYATHRTRYQTVSYSSSVNVTVLIMRESQLQGCALKYLGSNETGVGINYNQCGLIADSTCDKKAKCNVRTFGLSFPATTCLVMLNNKANNATVSVRVNNYFDSPRYYGTVFCLLFTILGGMYILYTVGKQLYTACVAKPGKGHGHAKPKAPLAQVLLDAEMGPTAVEHNAAQSTTSRATLAAGVADSSADGVTHATHKSSSQGMLSGLASTIVRTVKCNNHNSHQA